MSELMDCAIGFVTGVVGLASAAFIILCLGIAIVFAVGQVMMLLGFAL